MSDLVDDEQWPEGFFEEVVGGWQGELERPDQGSFESNRAEFTNLTEEERD
jgi:hypothetical protein